MEQGLPTWSSYVQTLLDERGWSGVDFEKHSGISRTRLVDWRKGSVPSPDIVRKVAETAGKPVIQAYVAAGYLTAEEAHQRAAAPIDLSRLTDDQLLAEIRRRMAAADTGRTLSRAEVEDEPGRFTTGRPKRGTSAAKR
ncbi:helix-turn-helix domain-containing protein [Amycolatopsis thermophila]|uniref:Transcriptional regulator with XRE-family HTH domain n=1 Tax=Amycolatopsis thermophila TaxID=206084 RepID=A0ABU0ERI7_9PSEU|nr:helix-turn-helix transcriptional regulator [Amycolatopsis thermophila]MDQ0377911.1 transcriptional regulator with XRE-family HTH domain [Amycolatopsis thermophila]